MKTGAEFFCFKDAQANIIDVQANIVAFLDNNRSVVVKYKYDAWGKCTVDASTTKDFDEKSYLYSALVRGSTYGLGGYPY